MLNQIGMISGAKLAKWRRYSIFGMVVFAGLVVPGNDPITMGALALALILLYEVSVQVTRIHDKRKAKRLAADGLSELSDDEASALPDAVGGTDGVQPVAAAGPVPQAEPLPRPPAQDFGDAT